MPLVSSSPGRSQILPKFVSMQIGNIVVDPSPFPINVLIYFKSSFKLEKANPKPNRRVPGSPNNMRNQETRTFEKK